MKRNLLGLSLIAVFVFTASLALAGSTTMHITVPFDFYAGTEQLPAGDYVVTMQSGLGQTGSMIAIHSQDGNARCLLLTRPGTDPAADKLLFNKYGTRHFLSSISIHGFKASLRMQKHEKELQAQFLKDHDVVKVARK